MKPILMLGAGLVGLTGLGGWFVGGRVGLVASSLAGGLGLTAHLAAAVVLRRNLRGELAALTGAFVTGMGIRLGGAAIVFAAVLYDDRLFPPGPMLFGYVAVLTPLLLMEIRFLK